MLKYFYIVLKRGFILMKEKNISHPVLVVEDDPASGKLLKDFLISKGYSADLAVNGNIALEMLSKKQYPVILTDLEMPEMGGSELIDKIKEKEFKSVIFVLTAHSNPEVIVDIMKKGVYDYIVKPVNVNDLFFKVNKAYEYYKILQANNIYEKEKTIRLENQLEWYKWKERAESTDKETDKTMFKGLLRSFNQGAGFGAIVTLLNLIVYGAQKEKDYYKIDAALFETLAENNKIAEKAINTFAQISGMIDKGLKLDLYKPADIYKWLMDEITKNEKFASLKNQKVLLSDPKETFKNVKISLNKERFMQSVNEIIFNAFKFSKKNTDIIILMDIHENEFILSFLNDPEKDDSGNYGIEPEYENLIFEPFFRLRKDVQEVYKTLDFGLGLTLVEKIMDSHNGRVEIANTTDYSNMSKFPETKTILTLKLPVNS